MVSTPDLGVLFAAIATPYDTSGAVDADRLAALVDEYVRRGVEGIYCAGSSGEGLLLDEAERALVTATAVSAAAGRVPVVAHVGALSTRSSIGLAEQAHAAGAAAVSMIPPIYYRYTPAQVLGHYRSVMDRVDVPMIVYNIPQFTGVDMTGELGRELLADPRVVGVKHTSHDLFAVERITARHPRLAVINGFDEIFVAASAAGTRGSIGTTVGVQVELFRMARAALERGDLEEARRWQARINTVVDELVAIDVFPAAKMLSGVRGGSLGECRAPFTPLADEARERVRRLAERLDAWIGEAADESATGTR
ncbi:dihydrodipicolinate synthase family protein [Agromyces silvae]|uniref:dihydrodipicolinate synthase family protein n=1 Tax=Agromyces silvae TaxID=3388266 RepID=UPI00280C35A1|nr:dihydrodipicolinate synthase family protein [Agromyces protaetiae]